MSNTHCRFCNVTVKGLYIHCPKCGTNLMHPDEPKIEPEEYEVSE